MRITIHQQATCLQLPHQSKNTIYPGNKLKKHQLGEQLLLFVFSVLAHYRTTCVYGCAIIHFAARGKNQCWPYTPQFGGLELLWVLVLVSEELIKNWVLGFGISSRTKIRINIFEESDAELDFCFHLCVELEPRFLRFFFVFCFFFC